MTQKEAIEKLGQVRKDLSAIMPDICNARFCLRQDGLTNYSQETLGDAFETTHQYANAVGSLIDSAIDYIRENRDDLFKHNQERLEELQAKAQKYRLPDAFTVICYRISKVADDVLKLEYTSDES